MVNVSKRAKRIAKSLETAIDRACRSYGGGFALRTDGFEKEVGKIDAAELRALMDLWTKAVFIECGGEFTLDMFDRDGEAVTK